MASKLIYVASHEAESQTELSLREAFELLESKLRPPFCMSIPDPEEYSQLNRAIVYGVLSEPHFAETHFKHLHAIVVDGYGLFVNLVSVLVGELYGKLVESVRNQLIWVVKEMIDVSADRVDGLVICLLRQIVGGDYGDENLWLCFELVNVVLCKWDLLLDEHPWVLSSALYTFLRLLADQCRLLSNAKMEALKRLEIEFCVKMLKEEFHLCLKIGRDLIRLLQDLVHVPVFRDIWRSLVFNPTEFKTPGFSDISQIYVTRTSTRYFLLRITTEMETQLRFLLTHVKFGNQKRYQLWFARKFLRGPDRETLIIDIVRFICCAHHPPNEIIQSDIIPRWAVVGWLLTSCRKNYVEGNVKLALLYDWLFFDEKVDNIMNIEPAMLLMVHSIPKYTDMTHRILEFLFLLVENYDVERKDIITMGVSSALNVLVKKGVVHSLDIFTCDLLSPFLKEKLQMFLAGKKIITLKGSQSENDAPLPPSSLPYLSHLAPTPAPFITKGDGFSSMHVDLSVSRNLDTSNHLEVNGNRQVNTLESLVQNLEVKIKMSSVAGLQSLEEILRLFMNSDTHGAASSMIDPEALSSKLTNAFELNGYKLFSPLKLSEGDLRCDDEIRSATSLITRAYFTSHHQKLQEMLLLWSKNGFPVGARLLSYASRLASEASIAGYIGNAMVENNLAKISDSEMPLLIFHADGYFSTSQFDGKVVSAMVDSVFAAYRRFLISKGSNLHSDLTSCSKWEKKRLKSLFCNVFFHLSDLSVCNPDIIKLLVDRLDHADLVDIQFEIGLKRFSTFGENAEAISSLILNSLQWGCLEQHKLWGLIRSELAISGVQVEKIILNFFCSGELHANVNAIAIGGLLTLCCCLAPTTELVGVIMLLPNNAFQDFAAATLSSWITSNSSKLFDSLAEFSDKFVDKNGDSSSAGIEVNHSAVLWLLRYFNDHGMEGAKILSNFSIPGMNTMQQQT